MWAVGQEINGQWSFIGPEGRSDLQGATLFEGWNPESFAKGIAAEGLGDYLVRVCGDYDGKLRLGVSF